MSSNPVTGVTGWGRLKRLADRLIAVPLRMVHDHWFRSAGGVDPAVPCAYGGCGRPAGAHLRWCGEWMWPRVRRWRAMAGRITNFT